MRGELPRLTFKIDALPKACLLVACSHGAQLDDARLKALG
jgi:hypothetical protein